jgi:hypothetical protein
MAVVRDSMSGRWRLGRGAILLGLACIVLVTAFATNSFSASSFRYAESDIVEESDIEFAPSYRLMKDNKIQFSSAIMDRKEFLSDIFLRQFDIMASDVGNPDLPDYKMLVGKAVFMIPAPLKNISQGMFFREKVLKRIMNLSGVEKIKNAADATVFKFTKPLIKALGIDLISTSKVEFFSAVSTISEESIRQALLFNPGLVPDNVLMVSSSNFSKVFLKGLTLCGFQNAEPLTYVTCRFFTSIKSSSIDYVGDMMNKPVISMFFKKYNRDGSSADGRAAAAEALMMDQVKREAIGTASSLRAVGMTTDIVSPSGGS